MYNQVLFDQITKQTKPTKVVEAFRKDHAILLEGVEFPSWKRIKVTDTSLPAYRTFGNVKILFHKQEGLIIEPIHMFDCEETLAKFKVKYGPSPVHKNHAIAYPNAGNYVLVKKGVCVKEPIVIKMTLDENHPFLNDHHIIEVEEKAKATLVVDYETATYGRVFHNGVLNIIAKEGAEVKVVVMANMPLEASHIFGAVSILERDAKVTYSSIDLSAGVTATDYSTYLVDENAHSKVESIYLGDGVSKMDLGYNIYHKGRRTISDIMVKGALLDHARKVFRGSLFFDRGAKRAEGAEQEYVILLSDQVQADSIPALMCDEDDVRGEHAASAGQVDPGKLFYLMSRGLTEKEAKELVILASFAPILSGLPIEGLKEQVSEEINKRLNQDLLGA